MATSEVVHSFSSDQQTLQVDRQLTNRSAPCKGESGRARIATTCETCGRQADGCLPHAAVAAMKSSLTNLNQRETIAHDGARPQCVSSYVGASLRQMSAAHTDPSFVTVVAAFLFERHRVVKATDASHSVWIDGLGKAFEMFFTVRSNFASEGGQCQKILQKRISRSLWMETESTD